MVKKCDSKAHVEGVTMLSESNRKTQLENSNWVMKITVLHIKYLYTYISTIYVYQNFYYKLK